MTQPSLHRPNQPGRPLAGPFPPGPGSFPYSPDPRYGAPYAVPAPRPGHSFPAAPNHWSPNSGPAAPTNSFDRPPYPGQFSQYPGQPAPPPARPNARYAAPPAPAPRPRKRRLGLVIGLLVVAALAAAGVVLAAAPEPVRVPDTGAIQQPGTLSVFDLQAGDCYSSTQAPPAPGQSQPISVVEAVQCDAPHTNQVIGRITYSTAEFATGVPAARADADCSGEFQAKLDPAAYGDPSLKPGRLTPADAATWASTPVVACVVFSTSPISRSLLR